MVRYLPLFALLLAAAPAAADERRYSVSDFDRVIVEGPYTVRLVPGRTSGARAVGDRRGIELLRIDTTGQTLRIRRDRSSRGAYPEQALGGPVAIELATRNLRSARLIGPGRMEIEDASGMKIELVVEGGGQMRASGLKADEISIGLLGSGRIEAGGVAEALSLIADGSGDVDAGRLAVENATVKSSTSGTVTVAASETAAVDAAGVGIIQVIGRPDCTLRGVAAANVRCGSSDQGQRR